jgi:hypothetical protein
MDMFGAVGVGADPGVRCGYSFQTSPFLELVAKKGQIGQNLLCVMRIIRILS